MTLGDGQLGRACRRLMEVVHQLHKLGYERLRLDPGMSPSGVHWRCRVHPVGEDATPVQSEEFRWEGSTRYSSGGGIAIFGWSDAEEDTPVELAKKFVARFPRHAAYGFGPDPEYARWYAEMIERTAPMGIIYGYADYPLPEGALGVWNAPGTFIPPPPRGTA